eukprot:3463994-Prymnesium_polylepis.1
MAEASGGLTCRKYAEAADAAAAPRRSTAPRPPIAADSPDIWNGGCAIGLSAMPAFTKSIVVQL